MIFTPLSGRDESIFTGRIASYHSSPTALNQQNLLVEGIAEEQIATTGNTVIDALRLIMDKIKDDGALSLFSADTLKKVATMRHVWKTAELANASWIFWKEYYEKKSDKNSKYRCIPI